MTIPGDVDVDDEAVGDVDGGGGHCHQSGKRHDVVKMEERKEKREEEKEGRLTDSLVLLVGGESE